jgi:hypothetical protein
MMIRHLSVYVCLAFVSAVIPLRAANRPHAGTIGQNTVVWTTDHFEKLRVLGLIPSWGERMRKGQRRQSELDALQDLARRHGIPPGTLRSQ